MTPTGMTVLRVAATVVHALPGVRVRLLHGERALLTVARPCDADGPAIGPCAFRATVARAHRELQAGGTVVLGDLPVGAEPAIEVAIRNGDVLPSGVYRVVVGDTTVHGFVTTLPPRRCRQLLEGGPDDVHLHHDAATDVTLVHTADTDDRGCVLNTVIGAFLADEIAHALLGGSAG